LKTSIDADEKKEGLKMAQIVKITMENGNQIRVELDPVQAPITVANFVKLVEDGFYNGLIFHRVNHGFMIQGGCPDGTGMGGPGWQIKGEFKRNGVNNEIQHTRGVISMARSMMPDSAGSQFFIMHQDSPHLDGQYAAFGHVIEGIETVDAIAAVKTGAGDRPVEEQKIAKIEIEV
jgi:peptidyl-prolyl cis-trans isomerase B (cyclophilin B)